MPVAAFGLRSNIVLAARVDVPFQSQSRAAVAITFRLVDVGISRYAG